MPSNLSNLKNKVEKLNVGKLVTVPVNSRKLSHVVKNDFVKKKYIYIYIYNARSKDIGDKVPDITNLATDTTLNAKINRVKNEIPSITNLALTTALTAIENKIPDHSKCFTTPEFI